MSINILFLFLTSLFLSSCDDKSRTFFPLKNEVQYFFKPWFGQRKVLLSLHDSKQIGEGQNYSLNLDTGIYKKLPGHADAIMDPKGVILTTPYLIKEGAKITYSGMKFFWVDDTLNENSSPFFKDESLKGKYQSLGYLNEEILRVLTDYEGLSVKDFKINSNRKTFEAISEIRQLCPIKNFNKNLQLPVLSKNGRMLGVYNLRTKSSEIYKILENDKCQLLHSLKEITGKMDFSFDHKWIVYFSSSNQNQPIESTFLPLLGSYLQKAPEKKSREDKLSLTLFNLETQKKIKLSYEGKKSEELVDFYFPSFLDEKSILSYAKSSEKLGIVLIEVDLLASN